MAEKQVTVSESNSCFNLCDSALSVECFTLALRKAKLNQNGRKHGYRSLILLLVVTQCTHNADCVR